MTLLILLNFLIALSFLIGLICRGTHDFCLLGSFQFEYAAVSLIMEVEPLFSK